MSTKIFPFLFALCIGILFFSCKKENPVNPTQETFDLAINQNGSLLTHEWTQLNVSNFEKYILVRAFEAIPVNYASSSSVNGFEIVEEFEDISSTKWSEFLVPENNPITFHYRVFAQLSDVYIASNEVIISVENNFVHLNTQNINVYHHPELKMVYISNFDSLYAYDYVQHQMIATSELPINSFNIYFDYATPNGEEEIYFSSEKSGTDEIVVLDAITLESKTIIETNISEIRNIWHDKNELIYVMSSFGSVEIINRSNGEQVGLGNCQNCMGIVEARGMQLLSSTEKKVGVFSLTGIGSMAINILNFSTTGELVSENPIISMEGAPLRQITISPDKNHVIVNNKGTVCDLDGNIVNALIPQDDNDQYYKDFAFSDDGSKLYAINGELFNDDQIKLESFSFPELELQTIWLLNTEDFRPSLFYDNEQLIFIKRNDNEFDGISIQTFPFL